MVELVIRTPSQGLVQRFRVGRKVRRLLAREYLWRLLELHDAVAARAQSNGPVGTWAKELLERADLGPLEDEESGDD